MRSAVPSVKRFMTRCLYVVGPKQTLKEAHEILREHKIRHLPVVDGDRLVGIVTMRDLHLLESLRDVAGATDGTYLFSVGGYSSTGSAVSAVYVGTVSSGVVASPIHTSRRNRSTPAGMSTVGSVSPQSTCTSRSGEPPA